jgi:hypothetical protein
LVKKIWLTNCFGGSKNIWPTQYSVKKHLADKLLRWVKKHLANTIFGRKQFGRHNIWLKNIWPTNCFGLPDTIFGQKTFGQQTALVGQKTFGRHNM